ncbi:MAG: T9SS type A sorting domain-containing protein [Chitinophagaceae bacterium]
MKKALSLLFAIVGTVASFAQTISVSMVTAPCNNNGVVQATTTGFSGTVTYTFATAAGTLATNTTGTYSTWTGQLMKVTATSGTVLKYAYIGPSYPFTFLTATTSAVCPALGTASVSITGGTSPYTVQWNLVGSSSVVATGSPASLPNGQYEVLITDAAGCTSGSYAKNDSIVVSTTSPVNFSVATTVASCLNGTATVTGLSGGTSPYSYTWSNAAHTSSITNLILGYYSVAVTDANGCTTTKGAYLSQNPSISVHTAITNATCLNNDGSATALPTGGTPPYSYSWTNLQTTALATGLTGGVYYFVTATDANGCIGKGYARILSSTPITATYATTSSLCTSATGSATVTATGGATPYVITWNTYPVQTGATATGLASGTYNFHVTDANGCVATGAAYIPPISVITASVSATKATCLASNGTASVTASGLAPLTYLWSNSATTSAISGVPAGYYYVQITDSNGCKVNKYAKIEKSSPISIGFSVAPASCIYNSDGAAVATASGGTSPYTYTWGMTTGSSLTGAPTGNYYVKATDAVGCYEYAHTFIGYNTSTTSCYCTVTGTVYKDANSNCTKDASETGIPNIMIHCSGRGYTYTNSAGVYSFKVPSGTYNISQDVEAFYPLNSCQTNPVAITTVSGIGCISTVNFGDSTVPIHDMATRIVNYGTQPIPGNTYTHSVIIKNEGTLTESSILTGYKNDGQLGSPTSISSAWSAAGSNHYQNNSGFSTLVPGAAQSFLVQYSVPTNIPIRTSVLFADSVAYTSPMTNWLNDYTPWNNVNAYTATVTGSYDPNYKEVSPVGVGTDGEISTNDSILTYTIHFQNTGTAAAQKVVVIDTLSPNVDMYSLRPIAASHDYTATLSDGGGIATFTFDNINLPDSNAEPLRSQGYIMYSVHLKPNLMAGTQIQNQASIYFDFNPPMSTNTTLNTIKNNVGVAPVNFVGQMDASIYPNPANNQLYVKIVSSKANVPITLRILSLEGQVMQQQSGTLHVGTSLFEANTMQLASGLYFVEISDGKNRRISKLSILH